MLAARFGRDTSDREPASRRSRLPRGLATGHIALEALARDSFPFLQDVDLDMGVASMTAGLALLTGSGFGLLPALRASRVDLRNAQDGALRGRTPQGVATPRLSSSPGGSL